MSSPKNSAASFAALVHTVSLGDKNEQAHLESIRVLDPPCRSSRRTLRLADPGKYSAVQFYAHKTTSGAARYRLPHCLDNSFCPDGHRRRTCLHGSGLLGTFPQSFSLSRTAVYQLFLEPYFLQPTGCWICVSLAHPALGSRSLDDPFLPQGGSNCRMAANSLSPMAHFCCLFKLRHLAAQLSKTTAQDQIDPARLLLSF